MEQMPYPHIFCATCLSFVCGPQCPICRTVIEDPKASIQPAPFVLQTIISELDFQCPTCSQIKLHKLPEHQEQGCIPLTVSPPMPTYRVILRDPAADVPNPATEVPAKVPPPQLPNTPTQIQLPAPVEANPLLAPPPAYGQLTLQE